MENVKLLDGIFKDSEEIGKEYLLYLDVDRLVAPCYESAGQKSKKPRYGGWESRGISGHSIGHWLSAVSTMYAVTKDEKLKQKLNYAIDELSYVQSLGEDGYVSGFPKECFDKVFSGDFEVSHFSLGNQWVPWYSIHKIYAGLIDAYKLVGHQKALEVVIKLSNWAKNGTDNLSDELFERMLICEHGGMNEAMADLYLITGNEDYLDLAIRFCHKAVLEPLSIEKDELEGKHANTQIPKVIGAAKLYEITGVEKYREMAQFFWDQVTQKRSYVIGGNSKDEHFGREGTEDLGIQTTETCNTYNMLKLTEHLFSWNQDSKYMDYYEKALYNHILASQDPETGMKTYFVATQPGHFKVYCSPDNSFWCCTGTGMENPARYNRSIYYQKKDELFVNLFISSEVLHDHKNFRLKQQTNFPESNNTTLIVEEANNELLTLQIRVPYWASREVTAIINGKETYTSPGNSGYLSLNGEWNTGDIIEITLPMDIHTYHKRDESNKVAFMYGPIVLAGALGKENFPETDILEDHLSLNNHPLITVPTLVTSEEEVRKWIKPIEGAPLKFETEAIGQPGNQMITLIPFYELHHQRYTLYWDVLDQKRYEQFLAKKQDEVDKLQAITIDIVQPNEQQPEVEHEMKAQNSKSGYVNIVQRGWRDSRDEGFFSYQMQIKPEEENFLMVSYFGSDGDMYINGNKYERQFHISVDGKVIAEQTLKANKRDSLIDVVYPIPQELTGGKDKVEVKFSSTEGKIAGGVYGVRTLIGNPLK